jgi:hypothetical protein
VSDAPETITLSAIKLPSGVVYTGFNHSAAYAKAVEAREWNGLSAYDVYLGKGKFECIEGFVTSTGRFVDRQEGYVIATAAAQLRNTHGVRDKNWMASEDMV